MKKLSRKEWLILDKMKKKKKDLLNSGVVGILKKRKDMKNSVKYAKKMANDLFAEKNGI